MKITDPFLDVNGLVLPDPKHEEKPSDNGVYFTSVSALLNFEVPDYEKKIRECYLKTGLVARWKGNNFDNCAWDDYLGIAAASIKLKQTSIPREILWYGIWLNFFIYNTNGKLEGKDWLLRNIPIWPIMICAAFPLLRLPMRPVLWAVQKFFDRPDDLIYVGDGSGFQLQWVYLEACHLMGIEFKSYQRHKQLLHIALRMYYKDLTHPFNNVPL